VELAGTLAEIARHTLREELRRIDPRQASVRLIEAGAAPLPSFPPALQQRTKTQLEGVCRGRPRHHRLSQPGQRAPQLGAGLLDLPARRTHRAGPGRFRRQRFVVQYPLSQ
jgi:hypothetical protein